MSHSLSMLMVMFAISILSRVDSIQYNIDWNELQ